MKTTCNFLKTALFSMLLLALTAGFAAADVIASRTLTAGSVNGAVGAEVVVPVTINDPAGIGGIAFTVGYDPAILEFKGVEQATSGWTIDDPAGFEATDPVEGYPYYNPYKKETPYADRTYTLAANATLFYQFNDIKDAASKSIGRLLISGASADPLAGTALFNIRFKILGGLNNVKYPVQMLRTIINNPAAGYNVDTFVPVLVGVGEKVDGLYTSTTFPVIPATLAAGGVTVSAATYSIGGKVTYGVDGANATGCTVVLKKETSPGSNTYVYRTETTVGADGAYVFNGLNPGNFKIYVTSLDPNYNDYASAAAIALANANITDANAAMTLKPQPVRVSSTVTAGHIAGLMAKVVDPNGNVMGYFPVDPGTGAWETPLLPALASGSYGWYLVYGSLSPSAANATTFDTTTLKSISGTITGLPTSGGAVTVISQTGKISKTVQVTYVDGTETWTATNLVPANDYIVSAATQGYPLTYYNATTDVNEATAVDISSADKTGIDFTFTPPTKSITGWIKESDVGVAGLTVYGFEVNTFALVSAQTDGSGNFDLTVDPGTYEVFVIKSNGKIFYFYNEDGTPTQNEAGATLRTVASASVAGDTDNTNINITECDKTLVGKVTKENGDPVANVLIVVSNATKKAMGITGEDGKYAIGGLCDQVAYTVEMKPLTGGYAVQTASITAGTDTAKDFVIDTGSALSGTVKDQQTSNGVPGAMLYLKDKATGSLVGGRIYFSGADGKYEIRDIKEGEYTLEATHPDYEGASVDLAINTDMTQDIILQKGAWFQGTVTDGATAKALAGATIIVTRTGATPIYTVTGSDGKYKVYGLDATKTDYMIFAQRRGYERQVKMAQTPATSGTTADFALLKPTTYYKVSGTVKTDAASEAEIADAIVLVSSTSKNFFVTTQTGTDGKYEVGNLVAATDYKIVVVPPGLPTQTGTFTVTNADVTKDFTISLGKNIGGTITGSTTIPSTTKIYVFLYKGTAYQGFKVAGTDGKFLFKGLTAANDYKLLAVASGYTPQWYNGKASNALADAIDISSASKEDIALTLQAK